MSFLISRLGNSLYSLLPQNKHTANVAKIEARIVKLQLAISDPTNDVFQRKILKKVAKLETEKKTYEVRLAQLNGSFYQDPKSLLKQTWDSIVNNILTTFSIRIETREELESVPKEIMQDLTKECGTMATNDYNIKSDMLNNTNITISNYIKLEKERDAIQTQIKEIVSTQKTVTTGPSFQDTLSTQLMTIEDRQKELCGEYYQDPRGLLDQKWKASQAGGSDASTLHDEFLSLETERKSNEAQIFALREQISVLATSGRTIEALTTESIKEKVAELETAKLDESPLSGVDWTKTVVSTAKVAGLAVLGISGTNVIGF